MFEFQEQGNQLYNSSLCCDCQTRVPKMYLYKCVIFRNGPLSIGENTLALKQTISHCRNFPFHQQRKLSIMNTLKVCIINTCRYRTKNNFLDSLTQEFIKCARQRGCASNNARFTRVSGKSWCKFPQEPPSTEPQVPLHTNSLTRQGLVSKSFLVNINKYDVIPWCPLDLLNKRSMSTIGIGDNLTKLRGRVSEGYNVL